LKDEGTSQFLTQDTTVFGHLAAVQSVNSISTLSSASSALCDSLILASYRLVSTDTANQIFTGCSAEASGNA
jgi:hypothetical protein